LINTKFIFSGFDKHGLKITFNPDKVFFKKKALLNKAVDFRSRRFAFRGAGAEPPRRFTPAGSHLTSCARRSLRAFHLNQQGLETTFSFNRAFKKSIT
jgi:hypothetical protein